jgi:hypothetical protein
MERTALAHGRISNNDQLLAELVRSMPGAQPTIVITWPGHVTEVTPAKLAEVVANATRILSNASTELARRHIVPERP